MLWYNPDASIGAAAVGGKARLRTKQSRLVKRSRLYVVAIELCSRLKALVSSKAVSRSVGRSVSQPVRRTFC